MFFVVLTFHDSETTTSRQWTVKLRFCVWKQNRQEDKTFIEYYK